MSGLMLERVVAVLVEDATHGSSVDFRRSGFRELRLVR
jgi:hypothetical protein